MSEVKKTKVHLISGFLGTGKTTALKSLMAQKDPNEKWVIIVNEFGEIGIDGAVLSDNGIPVAEIAGGCLGTAGRMGILHLVGDQVVALAAVNLLGCLLLGVVSALLGHRHEAWRMFLVVGGIGAFTSWSSLAVQGATHPSGVLIVAAEALAGVCVAGLAHFATWRLMMRGSR